MLLIWFEYCLDVSTPSPLGACYNIWRPQHLGIFLSVQWHLAWCTRKLETVIFCCLFFVGETIHWLIEENLHFTADTTNHAIEMPSTLPPYPQLSYSTHCGNTWADLWVRLCGLHQQYSLPCCRTQPRTCVKPLLFYIYTTLHTGIVL